MGGLRDQKMNADGINGCITHRLASSEQLIHNSKMKKFYVKLFLISTFVLGAILFQSPAAFGEQGELKQRAKELREKRLELRDKTKSLRADGELSEDERKELRQDRRELRKERRELKRDIREKRREKART